MERLLPPAFLEEHSNIFLLVDSSGIWKAISCGPAGTRPSYQAGPIHKVTLSRSLPLAGRVHEIAAVLMFSVLRESSFAHENHVC